MGNKETTPHISSEESWMVVSSNLNYSVVQNRQTQQLYQEYRMVFPGFAEFKKEKDRYLHRQQIQNRSILKVEAIKERQATNLCSSSYELTIYTEHPKGDIRSIHNLQLGCAIYTILELLDAVQYLLRQYPEFRIDESKVFLSQKGRVYVWISHLASDNYPVNIDVGDGEDFSEEEQVQRVLDLVEVRTLPGCMPIDFIKPLRYNNYCISEASKYIRRYCDKHTVMVSNSLLGHLNKTKDRSQKENQLQNESVIRESQSKDQMRDKRHNHRILDQIVQLARGERG